MLIGMCALLQILEPLGNGAVLFYSHVEVAVSVMLRLLSDCPPQQVPHLADALLSMVHTLLEQGDTRLQVLACNTVSIFTGLM